MDAILQIASRWRAPLLKRVPKTERPMNAQDCIRVYKESPHIVAVQFRFTDSFGHASLTFDETRNLVRILTEATEITAQSPARS